MNRFWLRMPPETKKPWLPIDAHEDQGIECLTSLAPEKTRDDKKMKNKNIKATG